MGLGLQPAQAADYLAEDRVLVVEMGRAAYGGVSLFLLVGQGDGVLGGLLFGQGNKFFLKGLETGLVAVFAQGDDGVEVLVTFSLPVTM